jgi:hypothetical protein
MLGLPNASSILRGGRQDGMEASRGDFGAKEAIANTRHCSRRVVELPCSPTNYDRWKTEAHSRPPDTNVLSLFGGMRSFWHPCVRSRGVKIVSGEGNGLLLVGKLNLEDALIVMAERLLRGHEVIAPHPAEAIVV